MQYNQFPEKGLNREEVLHQLEALKAEDLDWKSGKIMAYVYATDQEAKDLAEEAYAKYFTENGLDPSSFPSLLQLERQVTSMVGHLLGGGNEAAGNCTSGGTESVILAVKTARDYARKHKVEITEPEIIIPETAHPCFHKAGHYLNVKVVTVPVDKESFRVDPKDMEAAISPNTILLVGSAPSYAHGVMDPIEEIAAIAKKNDILCHVDSCVGGMYLPFAKMLGHDIPNFDLSVDGVTSISCDLHKFGYVPKGCSTIIYKNKELRQHQFYTCSNWPGYTIVNPTVLSSKTGGPMAGAWAMFMHYGLEGYKRAVADCQAATKTLIEEVKNILELEVLGDPDMSLVAFKSIDENISIFDLAEAVNKKGWYLQVQLASNASPEAIHVTISHFNAPHIPALVEVIKETIQEMKATKSEAQELMMGLDATMISLLLAEFTPDMLDNMEAMLGIESSNGLPDDMAMINNILNSLQPEQRDMLLSAFVNRMFSNPTEKV
jgi:sphinganine-1-phosphate aldolase